MQINIANIRVRKAICIFTEYVDNIPRRCTLSEVLYEYEIKNNLLEEGIAIDMYNVHV